MESKTRRTVNIVALAIPAVMLFFSGVLKLAASSQTLETLSRYGVWEFVTMFLQNSKSDQHLAKEAI